MTNLKSGGRPRNTIINMSEVIHLYISDVNNIVCHKLLSDN